MNQSELYGFLVGTLLGDSYIEGKQRFACEQTSIELIKLKQLKLEQLTSRSLTLYERHRPIQIIEGRVVNCKPTYTIKVNTPLMGRLIRAIYPNRGRKHITPRGLDMLTLEGIAVWIMDEGYLQYDAKNSTKNLRICTDRYPEKEVNLVKAYFHDVWKIDSKIFWHKRGARCLANPRLSFNASNSQKLIPLIFPYVLPEFYYKLDLKYLPQTVDSKRVSEEYRAIYSFITQRKAPYIGEDIV